MVRGRKPLFDYVHVAKTVFNDFDSGEVVKTGDLFKEAVKQGLLSENSYQSFTKALRDSAEFDTSLRGKVCLSDPSVAVTQPVDTFDGGVEHVSSTPTDFPGPVLGEGFSSE
jgi:hypothetical protein